MSLRDDLVGLFPDLRRLTGRCRKFYVVGGAVRDLLRGAVPADVDIASTDPLVCAEALGRKVIRLGREHLTAYRVVTEEHVYDFAELLDGEIEPDLRRRDFTVNAMAVDLETGELLDPHGGSADLARKLVRMVDAANFDDDPLRMLKAVRMAVVLDFSIDGETLGAIRPRAATISRIAAERVTYELLLILSANRFRKAVELLRATELDRPLSLLLPEDVAEDELPLAAALALVVREPRAYGERWRWSEALIRDVTALQGLVGLHDRVALFHAGENVARQLPPLLRALGSERDVVMPDFAIRPLLDGDEIAQVSGLQPGRELGAIKNDLLDAQVRGEVRSRDEAIAFVRARA